MGDGADRTRGCRVGRVRTLVVAVSLVAPSLAAPALVGAPARADTATATPATLPAAVPVTQATAGSVVHPLYLEVLAYDVTGKPLVTNTTPSGYTPATIKSYLGLTGTGSGQTIAIVAAYD